ncbi:hypothetical protein [Sapientia aquatica]|uniref:Uncharacterized protein n=1 Tax=Sapientia aquatica TaxID=1549640 RepID=A0A4R5VRA7_9BURK|nr:hypothetical protein [Sapientia aquatica]TDK61204.1 hypothetical protein E2I14_17595 [Sapientia aquatica]
MAKQEAWRLISGNKKSESKSTDGTQSKEGAQFQANENSDPKGNTKTKSKSSSAGGTAGTGASGFAVVADIAAGAAVVAATVVSGIGTAYVINKHVLNDDESLEQGERDARKSGRVGSYVGGGAGATAAIAMVCVTGEIGLGVTGVTTGLASIGAVVGGGATIGAGIALAVPALAACAVAGFGYGGYKLYQRYFG